jgi:hypothetical protein
MNTHISQPSLCNLSRKILQLKHHYGVAFDQIDSDTHCPAIREILGNHDVTGRLAAQIRQAFLQGAI